MQERYNSVLPQQGMSPSSPMLIPMNQLLLKMSAPDNHLTSCFDILSQHIKVNSKELSWFFSIIQ